MRVLNQTIEYGANRSCLGTPCPRLTWTAAGDPGEAQTGYEIQMRTHGAHATTDQVESPESAWIPWPFPDLSSRQGFAWRVRVWGSRPAPGDWSPWQDGEAGLLRDDDWSSPWVVLDRRPAPRDPALAVRGAVRGRVEFQAPAGATAVRLYLTGHGVYVAELNGAVLDDSLLCPGWTDYHHRVVYRGHDVTSAVHPGVNALGVTVADGWYRGRLGFNGGVQDTYGDDLAVLAQLDACVDGQWHNLLHNASWRIGPSPVTAAALYEGETWDCADEQPGWSTAGFDDHDWPLAETVGVSAFPGRPVAAELPVTRVTDVREPLLCDRRGDRIRVDVGQNIAGRLHLPLTAMADTTVTVRHAEVLEGDDLATRPLRRARSEDSVRLRAGDGVDFAPAFTVHGFRYADVIADPERVHVGEIRAEVVHTDVPRVGWFECSNPLLNRLHENTVWSTRDNFTSLPTDCPQRDERLGWTGDIQIFAPTARYLFDCSGLLSNWLADLACVQRDCGTVPNFVPWLELGFPVGPTAGWGDAAVVVPWVVYEQTGDTGLLRRQYESMTAWVDQIDALTAGTGVWTGGQQLGDWLDPEAPPEAPDLARTDRFLIATAYHCHTARLLSRAAAILGMERDEAHYAFVADRARQGFCREWVSPSGRVVSDTPTGLSLAICFDLLGDPEQVQVAGRRLAHKVWEVGYHIKTGFIGTPLICDALVRTGSVDDAYHLLECQTCPSWLYPITMGATTIWERWDALLPDGSINPGEMTSFNHYAFGAVCDFLHRRVAGLAPGAPGYRTVIVDPTVGGGLTWAKTSHLTDYGMVGVEWHRTGGDFHLHLDLPTGVDAQVHLPDGRFHHVIGAGEVDLRCECRPADLDPVAPQRVNLHVPTGRPRGNLVPPGSPDPPPANKKGALVG
ncbi:MAG: glycoside hydrolase family 78 protein [Propionibacteriaceae bacterium]|nr:glycoside hydrolase family 78 protein [Propionibacteriaceae bacterium]